MRGVETLKRPKRALIVDVPIELDNGTMAHFEGSRVQHNTSRGPGKGGVSFHQNVTLPEVMALGGSLARREATGRGVFTVGQEAAQHIGLDISKARIAVQGFGNVGGIAAKLFAQAGATVVAVQDHGGTVHKAAGLDVPALLRHVGEHGSVKGFTPAETLPDAQFWRVDCDILHERGILVVPNVIANAGGVTVSYFEWVQDFSSFFWSEDDINTRLVRIMREAFAAIWQVADEHRVSLRTATFIVACTRILQARELRGLYP